MSLVGMQAVFDAARLAHEVNRAYCAFLGDDSQLPWEEAPEWQKRSAILGAKAIESGDITTPGDSHRSWLEEKRADGWVFGPVKDPAKRTHPCMVEFEALPREQQLKDHIFLATVKAVLWPEGQP